MNDTTKPGARFRVGDTVRLIGPEWGRCFYPEPYAGLAVTVSAVHDGDAYFERDGFEWFVDHDPESDWGGVKVLRESP